MLMPSSVVVSATCGSTGEVNASILPFWACGGRCFVGFFDPPVHGKSTPSLYRHGEVFRGFLPSGAQMSKHANRTMEDSQFRHLHSQCIVAINTHYCSYLYHVHLQDLILN
ncbi:hypothetical protein V6N11_041517 [Hibiscus sabdariffa]|uniref:Uncharacterized protein n=1 Tax=Hibiscus sabdariffa TaxID=183260 RepID=A0ABR2RKP2_9ROSI